MGYCWDHRKIPWAIIPDDPWYFIRRKVKNPLWFSCYLFEIFFALKFWPRHFRSFYFLTNPFSEYFDLDRAIRFRSGFVLVRVSFNRLPPWSWPSINVTVYHRGRDRPTPARITYRPSSWQWPSSSVTVTVLHVCMTDFCCFRMNSFSKCQTN